MIHYVLYTSPPHMYFFHWLSFENNKLLNVRMFVISPACLTDFTLDLKTFGRHVPQWPLSKILQILLLNRSHYSPAVYILIFLSVSLSLLFFARVHAQALNDC